MPESPPNGPRPGLRLAPGFGALLAPFDLDALAQLPDTIYGLDADLRLAMFNPAWFAFADANGGMPAVARDWVPELVANPLSLVSHDLCDVCLDFYYPAPDEPLVAD